MRFKTSPAAVFAMVNLAAGEGRRRDRSDEAELKVMEAW